MRKPLSSFVRCLSCLALLIVASCESIDCTLNNIVTCNVGFYASADGTSVAFNDTLTITAMGTDSVLLNRAVGVSKISLPMSYYGEADTLNYRFCNGETGLDLQLTMRIEKSNTPHFESPDCPTTMFHQLHSVSYTTNKTVFVDSVILSNPEVNYGATEHIKIYFHTAD